MPGASWAQTNFLGGEWSKTAQGRFDDPSYKIALGTCLNYIPIESGALTRRPGTAFAGTTRNGAKGRVATFNFDQQAAYSIEFTDGHLRFRSGLNLVTTNDGHPIVSVSVTNPAVVQLGAAASWSTGDQGYILNLGTGSPLLQNRVFSFTMVDTTHVALADPLTGQAINGALLNWTAASAVLVRIADIATSPFTNGTWTQARVVQAETNAYLLDGNGVIAPQLLTAVPPAGGNYATFALAAASFQDGPYLDAGTTISGGVSNLVIQSDGSYLVATGGWPDSRRAGLTQNDVGRMVRLFNEPKQWPGSGTGSVGDFVTLYTGNFLTATYWKQLTASATTTPGTSTTDWLPLSAQQATVWTWGTIATVVTGTRFTVTIQGASMLYTGTGVVINQWRIGVYSNEVGWPTCGTYHEGRLWLAGAIPNRIDASTAAGTNTFSPTQSDGTVTDNNGIDYTFLSNNVNPIYWMQSDDRGIICGTQSTEWLVSATTQNLALSPSNIQAHPVTHYGAANIEPRRTGQTIVFVQRYGRKLLEYFADVFSGRLQAPNLTRDSRQLTQTGLAEIAYQQEMAPIVWGRRTDGTLVGWTYKRENMMSSQGPSFIGGHRHALGSGRVVESIAGGPSLGGNLDTLTMVTNDPKINVRHVEILTNLFDEGQALSTAWFLDDAVAPSSYSYDLTAQTVTLNGLWHLNGKTVDIFMAGLDGGQAVVANGSITVNINGTVTPWLTVAAVQPYLAALPAVVGFSYNSDGQKLRPAPQAESGAANGPAFGKVSRAHQIAVLVQDAVGGLNGTTAAGLQFGSQFTQLKPALFRNPDQSLIPPTQVFSGIYWSPVDHAYTFDENQICWRISRPFPATIPALSAFQQTQDRG